MLCQLLLRSTILQGMSVMDLVQELLHNQQLRALQLQLALWHLVSLPRAQAQH
jgi:hypothetical protein